MAAAPTYKVVFTCVDGTIDVPLCVIETSPVIKNQLLQAGYEIRVPAPLMEVPAEYTDSHEKEKKDKRSPKKVQMDPIEGPTGDVITINLLDPCVGNEKYFPTVADIQKIIGYCTQYHEDMIMTEDEKWIELCKTRRNNNGKYCKECYESEQQDKNPNPHPVHGYDKIDAWDIEYFKDCDKEQKWRIVHVVHYFDIQKFSRVIKAIISNDVFQNKTVEAAREYFGAVDDFTPERKAEIEIENAWCKPPTEST